MGILTDRIMQDGPSTVPSESTLGQFDDREQAIIDRSKKNARRESLFQKAAQGEAELEISARRQQRADADKASPKEVEPVKEMLSSLDDRRKVLGLLRGMTPKQREKALRLAPGVAQQMGDDRGGGASRTIEALSKGIAAGVQKPIMELVGIGGTADEIDYIRKLEAASQEFAPARPDDPWYQRGPLQATEMAPWLVTTIGGAGLGRAAATGIAGKIAARTAASQGVAKGAAIAARGTAGTAGSVLMPGLSAGTAGQLAGITAAAFPSQYAQEVDQLKAIGMKDDAKLRLLAGGTATVVGLIEGLVPNPIKAGPVPLTQGAAMAARQYLWEAAKRAPAEMSEEYFQGVTSGLGQHVAQYLDKNAQDKSVAEAFQLGWEQTKEAALPMAFLLGVPAVGGAGLSATRATQYRTPGNPLEVVARAENLRALQQQQLASLEKPPGAHKWAEIFLGDRGRFREAPSESERALQWEQSRGPQQGPQDGPPSLPEPPPQVPPSGSGPKTPSGAPSSSDQPQEGSFPTVGKLPSSGASETTQEPPIEDGMTRLYHGSATPGRVTGKAWFSTHRPYAENYRGKDTSELQYVDVPTEWVNSQVDPDNYGQTVEKGFTWNGELDSSFTGDRKIISKPEGTSQPTATPTETQSADPQKQPQTTQPGETGTATTNQATPAGDVGSSDSRSTPRRGEVGGKLAEGEVVTTSSGRQTTPFPKLGFDSERKAQNTVRRVDEWLWKNAVDEARSRNDDYNLTIFSSEDPKKLPPASKDSMEEYLFGQQPTVVPPITKPISQPTVAPVPEQPKGGGPATTKAEQVPPPLPADPDIERAITNFKNTRGFDVAATPDEKLSDEQREALDFAKSRGHKMVFVDIAKSDKKAPVGSYLQSDKVILVSNELQGDKLWGVVGHEMAHSTGLDQILPSDSKELKAMMDEYYQLANEDVRKRLKTDVKRHEREGRARMVQKFFEDKEFRDRLKQTNPSVWEKLREAILKFVGQWTPKDEAKRLLLEQLRAEPKSEKLKGKKPEATSSRTVDRTRQRAAAAAAEGITPYVTVLRSMPEGRRQYEAYNPTTGEQIATAKVIAGPGSIPAKLNTRKGRYQAVDTALYPIAGSEKFTTQWYESEASKYDKATDERIAEADRREKSGTAKPSADKVNVDSGAESKVKPETAARKRIVDAINANGGFENNSADAVEAIRNSLYETGNGAPSQAEIRAVMQELKNESGQQGGSERLSDDDVADRLMDMQTGDSLDLPLWRTGEVNPDRGAYYSPRSERSLRYGKKADRTRVQLESVFVAETKEDAAKELDVQAEFYDAVDNTPADEDPDFLSDAVLKEAAQKQGYDGIVFRMDGMGSPEVYAFPAVKQQESSKKPEKTSAQPDKSSEVKGEETRQSDFDDAALKALDAILKAEQPKAAAPAARDKALDARPKKSTGLKKPKKSDQTKAEAKSDMQAAHDAAAKLMEKIRSKLLSGVDPELMAETVQVAYLYTKANIKTFKGYVQAIVENFGEAFAREFAPYMESGWRALNARDIVKDPAGKVTDYLSESPNETGTTDTGTGESDQTAGKSDRRNSQDSTGAADDNVLEGEQTKDGGKADEAGNTRGVRNRPGGKVRSGSSKADSGRVDGPSGRGTDSGRASTDDTGDRGSGIDKAPQSTRPNYHLTNPDAIIGGGPKAKFARNRKAIEIVRDLEETGRAPTAEELDTLAGYTGWGAFGQELFQGTWEVPQVKKDWEEENEWLRIYLGEEEWKSANDSIVNAHYTDPQTVIAMWDMLRRMGFDGGRVLEPSMGIGNFFSLMPRDLMGKSSLTGIELDSMTAKIAKYLHPQANIQQKGYQESQTPDNFYDIVISNVPFGNYPIADRRYKQDFSIHNYFFKRAFDQVKPGGVIAFLTSNSTMDGKTQAKLMRAQLAEQGDLVTAIRLPSGAFQAYAGTKVVADLIIIRKRKPGDAPMENQDWINIVDVDTPAGQPIAVNEYWENNKKNILGTMTWGHGTTKRGPGMIVQQPENLQKLLDKAVKSVPEGIINTERTATQGRERPNTTAMRQNSVLSQDNDLWIVKGEQLVPLIEFAGWYRKGSKQTTIDANRKEIEGLLGVREAMRTVLDQQAASEDATEARAELNRVYDEFVSKHGPIGKSAGAKHLRKAGDPAANTLLALEEKKGDKYIKRPIFQRPTVRQRKKLDNPTVNDAFAMERNRSLDLNIDNIAEAANVPVDEVIRQLESEGKIYKTGTGNYDAADVFLSGNMARKLRQLEAAKAEGVEGLDRSIESVKSRIPEAIPYSQIEAKLGATWIESSDYADFLSFLLNEPSSAFQVDRRIQGWKVTIPTDINNKTEAQHTHGHNGIEFSKLMNAAMNNATVKLTMPDPQNPDARITDPVATAEANAKIGELREKFTNWIWTSPDRITRLSSIYNEEFNSTVTPEFDDVPLQFEGMTLQRGDQPFNLRKHQESAVWRGIVSGKGIFAHEVGTGKTLTMAALAMESRRLGLASKPLLLAHNANSMAVRNEILEAYPNANILYVDNLDAKTKDATLQAIATENWDLIVVPHSMAERFQLRPETVEALLKPEMDALEAAALEAFEESQASDYAKGEMPADLNNIDESVLRKLKEPTAKELVKERLKLRAKIDEAIQAMEKGTGIFFEDMGVDMVMVDEAHLFKKLPITTKQNIKGLNKSASQKGTMLMMLADYIRSSNNGRGVYLFTGTPITNTINEIYNMMRFVMAEEMEASNVRGWDGWFNNFATQETLTELSSGGTWENFDRLSSFVNLPELRQMVGQYMDIVFADEMPEFKPRDNRDGRSENPVGRPYKQVHNVTVSMIPAQEQHSEELKQRYTTFKNAPGKDKVRMMRESGGKYNPLVIEGEGVKLAMDPRLTGFGTKVDQDGKLTTNEELLDPKDPNLKINKMLHNAMAHYHEHPQTSQMIFMWLGHNDWTTRTLGRDQTGKPITENVRVFNLAREIKRRLMEEGVPENEIALFSTMTKEKRTETAQLMKEGKVRFAIGSTETMGTGVNAQDELIAMHHMDAPWMPGDLEQRNGRGHRQGNKWNTVHEYRYLTEGPQDGRRWQVLLTKSRFIEKFMKADGTERTIEMDDIDMSDDGTGNDMEKTFAAAAGDPRIMMRIRLEDQVAKLKRARNDHAKTITETVSRANQKQEGIDYNRNWVKQMRSDYQTWMDNRSDGDKPSITIRDKTIRGQQEINDELKALEERYRTTIGAEVRIGEYRGLPLFMDKGDLYVGVSKQLASWSISSLQGIMSNTPERISKIEKRLEKDQLFIDMAHKAVGEPFPKQKQLDAKQAKLDALLAEMKANPDVSPAWLRAGAPIGTAVFYKGKEYEVAGHRKDDEVLYAEGDNFASLPAKELTDKDGTPIFPELKELREPAREEVEKNITKGDGESRRLDEFTSPELQDRQSMGAARVRISSAADLVGDDGSISESKYASPDEEFERRWSRATRGIGKKTLATRLQEFWKQLVKSTVRGSLPELPRTKQFGEARSAMHAYQNAARYAQIATEDLLKKTAKPLSASDYDLFSRVVIMRDQAEAASKGERLSFGLTPEAAKNELDRVEALAANNERVQASLEYRKQWTDAMVQDFLDAHEYLGLDMTDRFQRENYFRHQVLYYMEAQRRGLGKKRVELTTNRSWMKGRTSGKDLGEDFDINANYLQAEWEVSTQMIADTKRAQAIGRIKRHYDKMQQLKEEAKQNNYVAVVGGQDVMEEIEELRGLMEELRSQGSLDAGEKAQMKEWSERLWELDPTMPFRRDMAIARDKIERGADSIGEEVPEDFMRYVTALSKQDDSPLQPYALKFLKALSDRKAFIKNALGDDYQTWEDVVPDDHEEVAIRPGRAMFQAYSVPEQIASELMADLSKTLGINADSLRPLTALGSKYTPLVVPEEIAAQMASVDNKMDFGWLDQLVTKPMNAWKKWRLQGPTNVIKYNLRNLSEVDKVLSLNPDALKYVLNAINDLRKLYSGDENIPPTIRDWVERGGTNTLVRVNELAEINQLKDFANLIADKKTGIVGKFVSAPVDLWRKYWSVVGIGTDLRESILRYAAYLSYLKQLESGKLTNYGGSVRAEVDGIKDNKDKAMRLSADLLGDYSDISLVGQFLRSRAAPFWSFQETNVRTYFRGLMNLASNEQSAIKAGMKIAQAAGIGALVKAPFLAYKLGRIAILFYGLQAMATALNQLWAPDDDDELPEEDKKKAHLTFGKNSKGEVMYFSRIGTAADVLDWVGLDSVDYDLRDVLDGRRTVREVMLDMAKSPVDKTYGMLSPFIKAPVELAVGQTAYPNVGKPRPIRDRGKYIAQNLGLAKEYDRLTGKPSTPYSVSDYFIYKVEPGTSAYYMTLDAKARWLKTARDRGVGYSQSAKGDALRNYKMAIRLKDKAATDKYLAVYEAAGGTKEGLSESLEWNHPAGGLSTLDAFEFYKSLSPVEKEEYRNAERFYYSELLTEDQAKEIRNRRDKRLKDFAFASNKDGSPKGEPEQKRGESRADFLKRHREWKDERNRAREALEVFK